jgi:hypothetical protein
MQHSRRRIQITLALLACALLASASCGGTAISVSPTGPAETQTQRLRIVNDGPNAAMALVVIFPNTVRVSFGDVPSGATTNYSHVGGGVYRYAAYRLTIDGLTIDQPVIDW